MGKKKSKEEIEAELKAEEERKAAELKAEEDRRAAEAAEAARLEALRIRLRNEEIERISSEASENGPYYAKRQQQLSGLLKATADKEHMAHYLDYSQAINPADDKALDTFLTLVTEHLLETTGTISATSNVLAPASQLSNNNNNSSNGTTGDGGTAATSISIARNGSRSSDLVASPLSPGLGLCSRLATASRAMEDHIADAIEDGDEARAQTCRGRLSVLRRLLVERLDGITQQLLDVHQEYGVDVKDGLRELSVCDSFLIRPTAEESARRGLDVNERHKAALRNVKNEETLGAELMLWANIPPGKISRAKQVANTSVMGQPSRISMGIELHKAVASVNAAVRAVWTSFDDAAEVELVRDQFDHLAEAALEGNTASRDVEERKKMRLRGVSGRPKSGRVGSAKGGTTTAEEEETAENGALSRPASAAGGNAESEEKKSEDDAAAAAAAGAAVGAGAGNEEVGTTSNGEQTSNEEAKTGEEGTTQSGTDDQGDAAATTTTTTDADAAEGKTSDESTGGSNNAISSATAATSSSSRTAAAAAIADAMQDPPLSPIGGVLHVELLAMPPALTVVKGMWAVSKPSAIAAPRPGVNRLPHPALAQGVSSAQGQAVKVKMTVPPTTIVPPHLIVARWDPEAGSSNNSSSNNTNSNNSNNVSGKWTPQDISDVSYHAETRTLTFSTVYMTSHALVRPPHLDVPYTSWSLKPAQTSTVDTPRVVLTLQTPRFPISIQVSSEGCALVGPTDIPELSDWISKGISMRPGRFVAELRRRGINIGPVDADAKCIAQGVSSHQQGSGGKKGQGTKDTQQQSSSAPKGVILRTKSSALERQAYADLAEVAISFEICTSEWNMHSSVPSSDIVVKVKEYVHHTEPVGSTSSSSSSASSSSSWREDPSVWRLLRFVEDVDVPSGSRAVLVADMEAEARGRDVLVQPPPVPAAPSTEPVDPAVPLPPPVIPDPVWEHQLVRFEGQPESGSVSHACARLALDARASPQAKRYINGCSPLFSRMLENILRITRPASFTNTNASM